MLLLWCGIMIAFRFVALVVEEKFHMDYTFSLGVAACLMGFFLTSEK